MADEQDSGERPQRVTRLVLATQDGRKLSEPEIDDGRRGRPPGGGGGSASEIPTFASEEAMANFMVADRLGGNWRYGSDGCWYRYDGRCWRIDDTLAIKHLARLVCRHTSALVTGQGGAVSVARTVSSAKSIDAVERIARSDLSIATPMQQFDADPWVLNTPEGLVNLHTGELLPQDRERLCTRIAGASPQPMVSCKQWLRFIDEVTGGDKAYADYLQRLVGYSLVGVIDEEIFAFLHGPSNTGKTKFVETLRLLHGTYGFSASIESFTAIRGDRNGYDLASFLGRRLITASETEEGRRWDQQRLKEFTGGDHMNARHPYGRAFDYIPCCLLVMHGNHRPRLGSADAAMRRRMHLLPFRHKPEVIDPWLIDKFRAELPAIMCWAVQGAVNWQRYRLRPPPVVTEETSAYFELEDSVGQWLDERCEVDLINIGDLWTSTRELFRDFRAFMSEGKGYVVPEATFVARLETIAGLKRGRTTGGVRGFFGVRLKGGDAHLNL